jgi:hypothetical protein
LLLRINFLLRNFKIEEDLLQNKHGNQMTFIT